MEEAAGQAGGRTVEAMAEQVYRALKEPGFQFDRSQGPAARRLPVGLGVLRAYAEAAVSELGPGGAVLAEEGARYVARHLHGAGPVNWGEPPPRGGS